MTDSARFASLKAAFADLCERDADARHAAIEGLRANDPGFAHELAALLAHLDTSDLQPDGVPGTLRFGPFRVLRRIGRGGMGDVYLAERSDAGFEQRVALKRVRAAAFGSELTARFLRERQVLARLQHPGIARLVDGGVDGAGRPWLAMDYVEGQDLLRHADTHALDVPARVALVRQVCAAVAYAHRNLVVHRDLKPANVLVTADGDARLLDFGIAKLLDDSDAEATRIDQRAHTLRYAAPEQLAGDRTTTATDIHALGVLLYELVAGASPFARAAAGEADWHRAILDDAPRPLADALRVRRATLTPRDWRRITGDLDRIVRKALAKPAGARYASVASLDEDLDDWLAARPLRSGIGGARAQTRYLLARYRWPLALAGAVLLALGIGAAVALQQARLAREQANAAHARLDTVLRVLGSANPKRFVAQEPTAGDFLVGAATALASDDGDPELARRALAEIAHALINLGRDADAEPVLETALSAAARDTAADDDTQLGLLALLMHAQATPDAAVRAAASAARIEALVRDGTASDAAAIDALARAAGTLSRNADFAAADRLLALAQTRLDRGGALRDGLVENYWRQRGWVALRADRADEAVAALRQADAVIAAAEGDFDPLRRAEGERLLAEALLRRGDIAEARVRIDLARPAFHAEYPQGHTERAAFDLDAARVALAGGDAIGALRIVDATRPVLAAALPGTASDLRRAATLGADAAARLGNCTRARHELALAQPPEPSRQPRTRHQLRAARDAVAAACGPG